MPDPIFHAAHLAQHLAVRDPRHLRTGRTHDAWHIRRRGIDLLLKVFPESEDLRFRREVAVLHHVRHPGLMAFDRHGRVATPQGALLWYTAEFVLGGDVRRAFDEGRWPTIDDAGRFGAAVAAALGALHRAGVAHCDVKPSNIALRHGAWAAPVLLDPGIVRFLATDPPDRAPIGTTPYMAPEQLRGDDAVPASDVFGLGVVLYKALAGGRHPFVARGEDIDLAEADRRIRRGPGPLEAGDLGRLVMTMLAHDPAHRPTVAEVAALHSSADRGR